MIEFGSILFNIQSNDDDHQDVQTPTVPREHDKPK